MRTYLGVLQGGLVAGRFVVEPLGRLGVNVPQEQLLHQVVQVVVQVLLLQPQQLQLVHGEVQLSGAVVAAFFAPQLVDDVGLPGAPRCSSAAAVEPLAELFGHRGRVTNHLDAVEVVLRLRAPSDDPGGLAEADAAPDHQRVGRSGAVIVFVVELVSLEGVVGVENVRACQELRAWSHLTAVTENRKQSSSYYKTAQSDFSFNPGA